jgi:hypothetical protein
MIDKINAHISFAGGVVFFAVGIVMLLVATDRSADHRLFAAVYGVFSMAFGSLMIATSLLP